MLSNFNTKLEIKSKTTCKELIQRTSNPQHGYLVPEKIINMSGSSLKDGDIGVLVQNLQYQKLELHKFDVSKNSLSDPSVENLFYTFRKDSPTANCNIKFINLSNNYINDKGAEYIAAHLDAGLHPNLKVLDISGNQITDKGHGYLAKALNSPKVKNIVVLLAKEAVEHGKEYIRNYLKTFVNHAKEQGIDTTHIATDKSVYEYFKNGIIVSLKMGWGYFKCATYLDCADYIIDGISLSDVIGEVTIYKMGKKAPLINQAACFFQAIDEALGSAEGISLIGKAVEFIEDN